MQILPFLRRLALLALLLPVAAQAERAYTNGVTAVYAGPDGGYPVVVEIMPNTYVEVVGCVAGYRWCDVILPDGLRGWIFAASLYYPYNGRPVPLPSYGAMIGIPLVTFVIGSYWGSHYHDRPWYGERHHWHNRPPRYGAPIHQHSHDRDSPRDYDRNHDGRPDVNRFRDHDERRHDGDRFRDHNDRDRRHDGDRLRDRDERRPPGAVRPSRPTDAGPGHRLRGDGERSGRGREPNDRPPALRDAAPRPQVDGGQRRTAPPKERPTRPEARHGGDRPSPPQAGQRHEPRGSRERDRDR